VTARRHILAIDLGTGGPKVALVADDGEIVASALRPVATHWIAPDAAEQDPEEVWQAILDAAQQVVREAGQPPESILGVACDSQYFSIVPIDADGRPVAGPPSRPLRTLEARVVDGRIVVSDPGETTS